MLHFPVLLEESVDFLVNDINGQYVDCTFGRGGHSKLILKKISSKGSLFSFDKDPEAYKYGLGFHKSENSYYVAGSDATQDYTPIIRKITSGKT